MVFVFVFCWMLGEIISLTTVASCRHWGFQKTIDFHHSQGPSEIRSELLRVWLRTTYLCHLFEIHCNIQNCWFLGLTGNRKSRHYMLEIMRLSKKQIYLRKALVICTSLNSNWNFLYFWNVISLEMSANKEVLLYVHL